MWDCRRHPARRVKLLEEACVIRRYTAIIDQEKVGFPINAFASTKLERQRQENLDCFAKAVSSWPDVADCYLMTGQRDYFRDLRAYERFLMDKLTQLDSIVSIETSFAFGQVKRSEVLPPD